ncbi:MAG: dATP/dGTP diphosphohydrolase domain-containing protein [Microcoleus sp.]
MAGKCSFIDRRGPKMEDKDPNNLDQHQSGAKLDAGKIRAGLTLKGFSNALKAVGEVGTYGAEKYIPNGWVSVPNGIERYEDALFRHLLSEGIDEESGLEHLAHAVWNALAVLELTIRARSEFPSATGRLHRP